MSYISTAQGRPGRPLVARQSTLSATAAALVALTAAGAALRFYGLGHQGLWYDESFTAMLVRLSPGRMIGLIPRTESTPPLYYCVAWVWVRIFGFGAAGLRSLSAVAGIALIPVAYAAASEMIGSRRAGLVCAALTAFNPLLWWYAQEARSYELLALLTAVTLYGFALVRRDPSPRRIALWVIACGLALATHYFAAVLVVPEAVWLLLVEGRGRRAVQVGVAIVALCGAALVPLAISQNGTGNDSWIARSSLRIRLAQIIPQFLIGTDSPERVVVKFLAFALALLALGLLVRANASARRGALLGGGLALAGLAIALGLILGGFDDVITRNLIELWVPAAVCASGGLAAARARHVGIAVTTALCAVGLLAIVGVIANVRWQRPEWPRLAHVLGPTPARDEARLILIQRYGTLLPLKLSMPGLRRFDGSANVTEIEIVAMHSPGQPLCWWGAQCNLITSPLQHHYRIAGFSSRGGYRRVSQFRIQELRADRPVRVTRGEFAAALTVTHLRHDELMIQRG